GRDLGLVDVDRLRGGGPGDLHELACAQLARGGDDDLEVALLDRCEERGLPRGRRRGPEVPAGRCDDEQDEGRLDPTVAQLMHHDVPYGWATRPKCRAAYTLRLPSCARNTALR